MTATPAPKAPAMQLPHSTRAREVLSQLTALQARFRDGLNALSTRYADGATLTRADWLRDGGAHGGGWRYGGQEGSPFDGGLLNRGSLNVSCVHYDDLPKALSSATALSCIVHPAHPTAPSLHTHISWTELRGGEGGGWRLMADLNPSMPRAEDTARFLQEIEESLAPLAPQWRAYARAQGDKYFEIPSLKRHRGVAHFYLEQWSSGDAATDAAVAVGFGERVIDTYLALLAGSLDRAQGDAGALGAVSEAQREAQLAYHSAYFLQVLLLDRGTSSGLLVHDQNDRGILGSLPQRVSAPLLRAWVPLQPPLQGELLTLLLDALPSEPVVTLTDDLRATLAQVCRAFYRAHPAALELQARGDVLPPTVAHHVAPEGAALGG